MQPFEIIKNGKNYDYRLGQLLDQQGIRAHFEKLGYQVERLWFGSRHELGILQKDGGKFFLKMATTEGQSIVLQNEIAWNQQMGRLLMRDDVFCVPHVFETGKFQDKFVWEIMDYWDGELLSNFPKTKDISRLKSHFVTMIRIIVTIQNLSVVDLPLDLLSGNYSPQERFLEKTKSWFAGIPKSVVQKYRIEKLMEVVRDGYKNLGVVSRHGDFAPWHMMILKNGKIGLFDAEHAMAKGVENYDLCYLVQRVFSVLQDPEVAEKILDGYLPFVIPAPQRSAGLTPAGISKEEDIDSGFRRNDRKAEINKLRTVLAARAIGGFLDESLIEKPNYGFHEKFMDWGLSLD